VIEGELNAFCKGGVIDKKKYLLSFWHREPIKCGDTIRLHHLETNKNLHSHHFTSPLSGNQEISCYGDEKGNCISSHFWNISLIWPLSTTGDGDSGDHWQLLCSGDSWHRSSEVKFKHIDTNTFLAISGRSFGRPINGQMEVVSLPTAHSGSNWQAAEGLFIHPREPMHANIVHSEL
jgi:dolichyl-phosphate-mannose--protein O-mannosyl transferase